MGGKGHHQLRNFDGDEDEADAIRGHAGEGITASSTSPILAGGEEIGRRRKRRGSWLLRKLKLNKESLRWRWKFLSSAFKWKRIKILDDLLFKIVSVLEAIVLVATVSFFYLCCGCHF